MNWQQILWAPLSALTLCGCGRHAQPQSSRPLPPTTNDSQQAPPTSTGLPSPSALSSAIPAAEAKGTWNKSQVETYLKDTLKLNEVSITSVGGDDYNGTGKGTDGMNYTMKIKQVPGGIACEFQTEAGGGRISFGNPVP